MLRCCTSAPLAKLWLPACLFSLILLVGLTEAQDDCSQNPSDSGKMAATVALRVADTILSVTPFGGVTHPLWLITDLVGGGGVQIGRMIECYLRKYRQEEAFIKLRNLQDRFNYDMNNKDTLTAILNEIEHTGVISSLQTLSSDNVKAAVYPVIPAWALLHMRVFHNLIYYGRSSDSSRYRAKSDEWLLFYTKLMLRYGKAHRQKLMKEMIAIDLKESEVMKSPATLIKTWDMLAYASHTKTTLNNLRTSCRLGSNDKVLLRKPWKDNEWLSCWGSGSKCKTQSCSQPFAYDCKEYEYCWACRGEVFTIFADSTRISHGTTVNLRYSKWSDKSYYLCHQQYGCDPYTNIIGCEGRHYFYNTETCPGKNWTRILSGCDSENLTLKEWDRSTDNYIYDGSFVTLEGTHDVYYYVFEVNMPNSECSNTDWVSKPQAF